LSALRMSAAATAEYQIMDGVNIEFLGEQVDLGSRYAQSVCINTCTRLQTRCCSENDVAPDLW
jgi:hypothetical protein